MNQYFKCMHVLIVSCGYPNEYQPLEGIFYRDQAEALAAAGLKVGVVSTVPVSLKDILKTRKIRLENGNLPKTAYRHS